MCTKRYYGFNFLWMYVSDGRSPEHPNLNQLDFIAEEGFNFVRLPVDYRFWTKEWDYLHPDEAILKYLDEYIRACNERGLHVSLNLHRAPGYCINWPEFEKHNLWTDSEAQEGFTFLWGMLAERYRHIPGEMLSFDLINEPDSVPPTHACTRKQHENVIRMTCEQIHRADKSRQIVIDGFNCGTVPLTELLDLCRDFGAVQSGRGYYPMEITHYKANWVRSRVWPDEMPEYNSEQTKLDEYYKPWKDFENAGGNVHIGEFGCFNRTDNAVALRWFSGLLSVFEKNGWGYALWNFEGPFGIVNHGRPGTVYEQHRGFNVDMKLLALMKQHMKG